MNDHDIKSLTQLALGLVLILGLFVVADLTSAPAASHSAAARALRQPASLVTVTELKNSSLTLQSVVSTLSLECIDQHKNLEPQSRSKQLRFIGKVCKDKSMHLPLYVTNTSNGFEATVFQMPGGDFSTDYMYLKEGKNRIVIREFDPAQNVSQTVSELTVNRPESSDALPESTDSR